jgi:DNA-binding transcriptional ArsR family regulator
MPSEVAEAPPSSVQVLVAPFIDFQFVLFLLAKRGVYPQRPIPDWLRAREAEDPSTINRAVQFWPAAGLGSLSSGEPYVDGGETLVLAWRAGVLFSQDVPAAIDAIEAQIRVEAPTPKLDSEPPEVVDIIGRRLAYLREDRAAAAEYVEILRQMWTLVEPQWRSAAAAEARETAADLDARARNESDLRKIVAANSFVHKDNYQAQIASARAVGELYVVPLALGNEGAIYWAFPGAVIVGVGAATPQKQARKRARLEDAAGRFKVLSDPTRLSILNEVMHGTNYNATTVTELASLFGLSQPTISVHMKLLREAGLVSTERDGNRTLYTANETIIRDFIAHAVEELMGSPADPAEC